MTTTEKRMMAPRKALLAAGLSALALSACTSTIDTRGYVPNQELISEILPGVDNLESVRRTLGFPTSSATFDGSTWYYISRRTENYLFFDEQLIDQSVVEVHFGPAGVVTSVNTLNVEDAREIKVVSRETPTGGRKLGFFEQLFGNLGRFGNRGVGYGDPFKGTGI